MSTAPTTSKERQEERLGDLLKILRRDQFPKKPKLLKMLTSNVIANLNLERDLGNEDLVTNYLPKFKEEFQKYGINLEL